MQNLEIITGIRLRRKLITKSWKPENEGETSSRDRINGDNI